MKVFNSFKRLIKPVKKECLISFRKFLLRISKNKCHYDFSFDLSVRQHIVISCNIVMSADFLTICECMIFCEIVIPCHFIQLGPLYKMSSFSKLTSANLHTQS